MVTLTDKAVELLADGEWHDLEWFLRELGKTILPGQAVREMERARKQSLRHRNLDVKPRTYGSIERTVESGKRRLALAVLRRHVGGVPTFEVYPPARGGKSRATNRKVRLRPRP